MTLRSSILSLFPVLLLCGGCSTKKDAGPELSGANIEGKVLDGGKPIKPLKDETITVSFSSVDGGKFGGSAAMNEDGTFSIKGPAGKGLPAGQYKIALIGEIYGGGVDRFADKFDAANSPFIVDLGGSGTENIEVDIRARKAVKK